MPGLIDAHVHVYASSVNLLHAETMPDSLAACWAIRSLERMLDRGYTTVRDTGGGDYGLFLGLERGWIRGPRLYYCGKALSQTGGHIDFRDPAARGCHDDVLCCGCGSVKLIGAVVDGVDEVRKIVREMLFRGANFIKFAGSGGVSSVGDSLHSIQFSDEEVLAIIDEVERHGAYCTAHIHPDAALRRAIRLGVHCIEHGTLIEMDTARMAADKGTYIVPTMSIIWGLAKEGRELGFPEPALEKLKLVKDEAVIRLNYMKEAGVHVGFGTDLLGELERYQLEEFRLRREVYSPLELLRQATSANAKIIGAEGQLGVIKKGAHADLIVVNGNPLDDLEVLVCGGKGPPFVMKAGQIVKQPLQ